MEYDNLLKIINTLLPNDLTLLIFDYTFEKELTKELEDIFVYLYETIQMIFNLKYRDNLKNTIFVSMFDYFPYNLVILRLFQNLHEYRLIKHYKLKKSDIEIEKKLIFEKILVDLGMS